MRRLVPLLFAVLAAGVLAGAAPAARDCVPFATDHTLCTQHFAVHYLTDPTQASYATETQAGDIAAWAEQAYAAYTSWGYAPPVLGADGYLDIYIDDLSGPPPYESVWEWWAAGPGPSNGDFTIAAPTSQLKGYAAANHVTLEQEEQQEIALNVFHLFQLAVWTPTTDGDMWLANGAATWAAFHASQRSDAVGCCGCVAQQPAEQRPRSVDTLRSKSEDTRRLGRQVRAKVDADRHASDVCERGAE